MLDTIIQKGAEPLKWLFVIGIAITLATTIFTFFATPVSAPVNPASSSTTTAPTRAPVNVNWILSKHLFGEAGKQAPQTRAQETAVEVATRLPLELQSVSVADEPERSTAIVAQKGKAGMLYRIDDNLPGNAKLVEIAPDRIVLRRAGVREVLTFPKSSGKFQATPVDVEDDWGDGENLTEQQVDGQDAISAALDEAETVEEAQAVLDSYRERLAADAAGTLEELGVEVADGGGYRIGSAADSPYLSQAGLQAGDVILSVNGQPVGDVQQDQLQLENILAQGSARIEVQRGSRRFFITASLPGR